MIDVFTVNELAQVDDGPGSIVNGFKPQIHEFIHLDDHAVCTIFAYQHGSIVFNTLDYVSNVPSSVYKFLTGVYCKDSFFHYCFHLNESRLSGANDYRKK